MLKLCCCRIPEILQTEFHTAHMFILRVQFFLPTGALFLPSPSPHHRNSFPSAVGLIAVFSVCVWMSTRLLMSEAYLIRLRARARFTSNAGDLWRLNENRIFTARTLLMEINDLLLKCMRFFLAKVQQLVLVLLRSVLFTLMFAFEGGGMPCFYVERLFSAAAVAVANFGRRISARIPHKSCCRTQTQTEEWGIMAVCKTFLMFIRCTYSWLKLLPVLKIHLLIALNVFQFLRRKNAVFFCSRFFENDNLGEAYVVWAISTSISTTTISSANSHVDPFRMPNEWLVSVSGLCRRCCCIGGFRRTGVSARGRRVRGHCTIQQIYRALLTVFWRRIWPECLPSQHQQQPHHHHLGLCPVNDQNENECVCSGLNF